MDLGGMGMPIYGMDPLYLVVFAVTMGLSLLAQGWIKAAYAKYSKVANSRNLTGAEAAALMLRAEGVNDVQIRRFEGGMLSDHFDPRTKVINLSPGVYDSRSVAAVGVACHEAGHALQHAQGYAPLALRSLLVMPTNIGAKFSIPLIIIGMMLNSFGMAKIGLILFGVTFLFQVVTLPVELNASSRSKHALISHGIVAGQEARGVSSVLNAAAFTYIAAAIASLMTLLYWAFRLGLLGGRRNND